MYKVQTLNQISVKGLECFARDKYEVASELAEADAIVLRSHQLSSDNAIKGLKAVARAGAGVNNIDVAGFSQLGIPVFNTPGANANAVKELVLCAMLLSTRGISNGLQYSRSLSSDMDHKAMNQQLEAEKKHFKGCELKGRTLGVVGLGAIGSLVADAAISLGMKVVGYDPALSVDAAWRLPRRVRRMENLQSLFAQSDYVSLHLPLLDATRNLVNKDLLTQAKPELVLLNFARDGIVDDAAVVEALDNNQITAFYTDFPSPVLVEHSKVFMTPHIGASTDESEENCAVMAAEQLIDFLENGNIINSVNFPSLSLERTSGVRLAITNRNVPKVLGSVLSVLADANINVIDMLNKSREDVAYNLLDLELLPQDDVITAMTQIDGVTTVRLIS